MSSILLSILEWVLSHLPSVCSRWYWTEKKLSDGIKFDLRPRSTSVEIWFCTRNCCEIYMELENRNSIPVVVDRINGEITFEGKAGPLQIHFWERIRLQPGQKMDYLRLIGHLDGPNKRRLSKAFHEASWSPRAMLQYKMEVDTSVRSFTKSETLANIEHIKTANNPDSIDKLP